MRNVLRGEIDLHNRVVDQTLGLQGKLASDPHRPLYHFLPPANWMNDPNGPIFWMSKYHLFYQYNPYGAYHGGRMGTMHWGHTVSEDLVHWTHLPIALAPTPGGSDKDGCYTGCTVDNNGVPTIIYTGVSPETQCIATSDSKMTTWKKYAGNPVIDSPPKGLEVTGFRDPCVWKKGNRWHMLVGSGIKDVGGAALLYESRDLTRWNYMHPFCIGDREITGTMWECPDFFALGDEHVMLVSVHRTTLCFVGKYTQHKFRPETQGNTDFGSHFYAAKTMIDGMNRRIMFGWIREGRSQDAQKASGWSGVLSLPRVLSLRQGGTLGMEPVSELRILRGKHLRYSDAQVAAASTRLLEGVRGDCLEIDAEFDLGDAEEFGLKVRCSPDESEETVVFYSQLTRSLNVDRERSSLSQEVGRGVQGGPFELAAGELLKLHIFLDRSVIEVFANGRACLTSRIYPSRPDSLGICLFAKGGSTTVNSIDIWEMKPI